MKKFTIFLCCLTLVFGIAGAANAVPFSVGSESILSVVPSFGSVNYSYSPITTSQFDLAEGASTTLNFFQVNIVSAFGYGNVYATIDFNMPVDLDVSGSGTFSVAGIFNWALGSISWDNPINIYYGADNSGLFTLALNNISGFSLGNPINISGTVHNSSVPVPEPVTTLLLGTGLIGILAFGRKHFKK